MQCNYVLLKVQRAISIEVKATEYVARICGRVGVGKEAGIDALELLLSNAPTGTLFQEAGVPGTELGLTVFGVDF